MASIVQARLDEIGVQLSSVKLRLEVQNSAKDYLRVSGWSTTNGAQKLESIIRADILRPLAALILEDRIREGWIVKLEHNDLTDKLAVVPEEPLEPLPSTNITNPPSTHVSASEQHAGKSFMERSKKLFNFIPVWSREETDSQHRPGPTVPTLQLQPQRLY